MLYAPGTFSGDYEPVGWPSQAEIISLHEFGSAEDGFPGRVNLLLARFALNFQNGQGYRPPILGTRLMDDALRIESDGAIGVDYRVEDVVDGQSSTLLGAGIGTWGEALALEHVMRTEHLVRPLVVAQAWHVGRVCLQVRKAGVTDFIVPDGLPPEFAPGSEQIWTRNKHLWRIREALGVPVLRLTGKL